MSFVPEKTVGEIENKLITFLEANLPDPYEVATGKTRSNLVRDSIDQLEGPYPLIQIIPLNKEYGRLSGQSINAYREQNEIPFAIFYRNQEAEKYTFSGSGLILINERQNMEFLELIKSTLKTNMSEFQEYFHKHAFGTIGRAAKARASSIYIGFLPFTVFTYAC